jgi:type I restriction enzyme, R subunit
LPASIEEDLARGVLEAIDMDSYRVEKKAGSRFSYPTIPLRSSLSL